ncbi:MAG TPA: FKBP-type peptidyl-prolyl cis-trans isomerase [Saprospiraceae bacterium]|jgi:FKBP-type peptidyl-prolyl cis-trans isomerase|nr:MAG: FKBP-type peptidyl-prolyl cis-trans isomerase [Candidatus Parvibacillus calidus]MBX2935902.1 FKBP-type peptidyl-prolyl cis-trans isomerase [Saprospiraceae bacterium]MBK7741614.1 FKBP-type peptidyl-prolyl cis-trans isomerase [Candidatus Parvibacillus calidus]MBX7179423.1 FKBP-type peptidyl-prolyl cis-trans isomerase [Saprospiraceae bacterium]MCB0590581.1 FKBP-type peptidyl-prolyl cis-trans isomerase [Saprospiraceae bacterium]
MKILKKFVLIAPILLLIACEKDPSSVDDSAQLEIDKQKIRAYLNQYNIKADSTSEGLYYVIDTKSDTSTRKPTSTSKVKVDYKGYLLNGKVFDNGTGVSFFLTSLIPAWQIGLPKFNEGDKGRLFVPSKLGYGKSGSGSIPANSPLIFDITLIKVD